MEFKMSLLIKVNALKTERDFNHFFGSRKTRAEINTWGARVVVVAGFEGSIELAILTKLATSKGFRKNAVSVTLQRFDRETRHYQGSSSVTSLFFRVRNP